MLKTRNSSKSKEMNLNDPGQKVISFYKLQQYFYKFKTFYVTWTSSLRTSYPAAVSQIRPEDRTNPSMTKFIIFKSIFCFLFLFIFCFFMMFPSQCSKYEWSSLKQNDSIYTNFRFGASPAWFLSVRTQSKKSPLGLNTSLNYWFF